MSKNNKIVKFKKRKTLNIGVIIFLIIFIYLIIYIIMFISKPHLSIYEIQRESLAINSIVEGVIIREEKIVTAEKAGKINYYLRDGARVKKNAMIYSIDDNNIYESLYAKSSYEITEQDVTQIKKQIKAFDKNYDNSNYSLIKNFKEDITGSIQQMIDINLMDQLLLYMEETGMTTSYNAVRSDKTGIVSYHVDSLDSISEKDVTSDAFIKEDYIEYDIRSSNLIETGNKVYKLITSEEWSIIAPIDKELFDILEETSTTKIRILEDDLTLTAPVEVYKTGKEYYAKLSFKNYMIRYKNYRFVEVEFLIHADIGLKIPLSSITEKEFFMVPLNYFTYGGNENTEKGLIIRSANDELNDYEYTFIKTDIYYDNGEYAYVDMADFTNNTYIVVPDNIKSDNSPKRITLEGTLEGVYCVNKGFAVFKRIEKISVNNEYCIVKEGTSNGLAIYDHIALDADTAIEEKSIY